MLIIGGECVQHRNEQILHKSTQALSHYAPLPNTHTSNTHPQTLPKQQAHPTRQATALQLRPSQKYMQIQKPLLSLYTQASEEQMWGVEIGEIQIWRIEKYKCAAMGK